MRLIHSINELLWGYPILVLLMGTHLYFTFHLRFIQRKTLRGIRLSFSPQKQKTSPDDKNGLSSFSALMTTLAATIGTGNIIGMSTAVALGGPGAVFWCWMTGVFGMATSYAECYLAHRYRLPDASYGYTGGAMYIFKSILGKPFMGFLYAVSIVAASLCIGCATQSNSIALTGKSAFHITPTLSGIFCALIVGAVLIGGCFAISRVCSVLVPVMGIFYIICCVILLIMMKHSIQPALKLILFSAFSTKSLCGGILGGGIAATLRYGIARGLFTNEAGMGTAGMTAAGTDTPSPKSQGLISMTGVFWDTVVMCGITGLLIVANFIEEPANLLSCGAGDLTLSAFARLPYGEQLLAAALMLFALSTMVGWFFLGERAFTFLTRDKTSLQIYKCIYLIAIFAGAVVSIDAVWELTDFVNIFLVFLNVYLLWQLRGEVHI